MATKKFEVNLNDQDSKLIEKMAEKFDTSESDVIRNSLKLMSLYYKTICDNNQLILKDGDKEKEIVF